MELRQLKYFMAVANTLNYRKAAASLFIVQPALSRQITALEAELGVQLLERSRRSVVLTPAGAYVRETVAPLLAQLAEIPYKAKLIAGGMQGELRIGYVGSSVHTFLPKLLASLNKKYPGIQTYLSELPSAVQLDAIKAKQLDIGFLRNPPPDPAFSTKVVWMENFFLVLPQNHSLHYKNFKSLKQLSGEKFILPPQADGELYHKHMLGLCHDAGFDPIVVHESTHGHTILKLVENGLGISILPLTFKKVATEKVKFIELKNTPRKATLTAVWLAENHSNTLLRIQALLPATV